MQLFTLYTKKALKSITP